MASRGRSGKPRRRQPAAGAVDPAVGREPPSPPPTAPRRPGRYERLYLERHARDLELAERPEGHPRGLWFDPAAGERVITFVEQYCKHHKGEWARQPLALSEWQRQVVRVVFGWKRKDGTRRFRIAYIEIPRKNGKSTWIAALGLYLLVADGEPGAEIYSSATKKDQAKIVWSAAAEMVKASPELRRFVKAYRANLHVSRTGSKFEPLGADSTTLDGLNPHGNLVDELHAHRDRGVWDVLDTAMGARQQPMTLAITTAGTYEPESIGWQTHDYACKVLDGVFDDDAFFAFIASADEGEETAARLKAEPEYYFSEEAQKVANPNYGVSAKADYLAGQAEKARRQPSFLNEYYRLHLNVWTQQVHRWLSLQRWSECDPIPAGVANLRELAAAREKALEGRPCVGGLDLSSKFDLTALVLVFLIDVHLVELVFRFWLPEETVKTYAQKGLRHYETWAKEGWITTTPGNVVDYDFIRREVSGVTVDAEGKVGPPNEQALAKRFSLQELAFDPYNATQISTQLQGDGIVMVETRQGYLSLSEPSKDLEARIVGRKLRHSWNPVMRFCVSNAAITTDAAGNIKPAKDKAAGKIDGVVAAVMGLSRLVKAPPPPTPSVYEQRGVLTV